MSLPTPPAGSAFSLVAHPDATLYDDQGKAAALVELVSGRLLYQPIQASRPAFVAGNAGRWGWRFDGVYQQFFDLPAEFHGLFRNRTGVTVAALFHRAELVQTGQTESYFAASQGDTVNNTRFSLREYFQLGCIYRRTDGGVNAGPTNGPQPFPLGWRAITVRLDFAGGHSQLMTNEFLEPFPGNDFPTSPEPGIGTGPTTDTDSLRIRIGGHTGLSGQYATGILRELHVFTSAVPEADMNALHARLMAASV